MTKTTLTALGAALIALGQELQGTEATDTPPAETTPTPRRGRPAKTTEVPPADEKPAAGKTEAELRELIRPIVEAGKANKVKDALSKLGGATKLADLAVEHHPAFVTEMKKLQQEVEAEAI